MTRHANQEERVMSKEQANAISAAVDLEVQDHSTAFKTWKEQIVKNAHKQKPVSSGAEEGALPF